MPRRLSAGGRIRATAEYAPHDHPGVRLKPIIVRTGRGDSRLTIEEAQRLQGELYRAIVAALEGRQVGDG